MKTQVIVLKEKERELVEDLCVRIRAFRESLQEISLQLSASQKALFETINGLYELPEGSSNVSFDPAKYQIRYQEPETESEKFSVLMDRAIRDHDFEQGARYRDLAKQAAEKECEALKEDSSKEGTE